MILFAFSLFLLICLLQQFTLVLLLVVALVFLFEDACHAAVAQQLWVCYALLYPLFLILLHLLSQGVLYYRFNRVFLGEFLPFSLNLSRLFSQTSFFNKFGIDFFLLLLPLLFYLTVKLVYPLILVVKLSFSWFEVIVLHLFVHLLYLLIF